jgi:mRNA-degrading endonuclease RelE of RelBE toxin-antitoxin system
MKVSFSERSLRSFRDAPVDIQRAILKQPRLLVRNLHRPSLRAKKYSESEDLWQARVSKDWRLYFTIKGDTYHIQSITPHPK